MRGIDSVNNVASSLLLRDDDSHCTRGAVKYSHDLTSKAKVTLDGKVCKAAELKPDTRIRVTIHEGDKNGVTRIEGLDKSAAFTSSSHEGKVISTTRSELVMMNKDGQRHSQKAKT